MKLFVIAAEGDGPKREIHNERTPMQDAATRPQWLDEGLYPFRSHFVEINGNRVHFIDEENGPTPLLLHGNPTWSFLYRHIITQLSRRFRCVAVDYPGFGLSSARPGTVLSRVSTPLCLSSSSWRWTYVKWE